ncbi:MAG: hypothetical protein GXP31_06680 [Kiritimatiellaeota bacterium]|nr:hypothetical protein [Kiritimatiellota bacterium]
MNMDDTIRTAIADIPPKDEADIAVSIDRWVKAAGESVEDPDYLPLAVHGWGKTGDNPEPGNKNWLHPRAEQLDDPRKMLHVELLKARAKAVFPSDAVPIVSPTFGNAFLLTALGLDQVVSETGDIYLAERPSKEQAARLSVPDDLARAGLFPKVLDCLRYYKSVLPPHVKIGLYYMMSPYDLAYLIRGAELLTDLYDDPDSVHRVLRLTTDLFVRATKLLKTEIAEPDDHFLYMDRAYRGGGLLCEDACILLSPELHREFSVPYTIEALEALGGGCVHFCGDGRHIVDNYLAIPNMYGILFGQLELNGLREDMIRRFVRARRTINLPMTQRDGESIEACFRRYLSLTDRKKTLHAGAGAAADDRARGESLLEIWHDVQDDMFRT